MTVRDLYIEAHPGNRTKSPRERRSLVRERRRDVFRGRRTRSLLGRKPGELGRRSGRVRKGLDRELLRLPPAWSGRVLLADGEVPEVLRGDYDEGPLRGRVHRQGDLPAHLSQGVV